MNIFLCTWKRELLMKIHCHKAVPSAFVSKGTVYYSAWCVILVMLYERLEIIQILLLSLFFEHNQQKYQRWCARWEDATWGAVIMAAQRMPDLSSIAVLRPKKPYCSALEQTQNVSLYFPPWDGMSTKCPSWPENLDLFHFSWPLHEFIEAQSYFSLLLQEQLPEAMLAVEGSAMPVQRVLDPSDLSSGNSNAFPCEAAAQFFARILLFCRWTH